MQVTVLNNQSFLDLSVQLTGVAENALLIARANNQAPSDEIEAGTVIELPSGMTLDDEVLRHYTNNDIKPATALNIDSLEEILGCEGIGCWRIGLDFVIN